MKFKIIVGRRQEDQFWEETYEKNVEDPQVWAEQAINRFNSNLRPGETERVLLSVEVVDNHSVKNHTWNKVNLVTITGKLGTCYDALKCSKCGITAKRFGIDRVILDSKFKRIKAYQRCDTSLTHIKKIKKKEA